jgi:adenine/guanine phosphoribosyltransferase-like PRPP-binding protein
VQYPGRVAGGRVLICDDVFRSGHTLNEVTGALLGCGAEGGSAALWSPDGVGVGSPSTQDVGLVIHPLARR